MLSLLRRRIALVKAGKAVTTGSAGFTLLEVVVVLALLALLTGLTMPMLQRSLQRERDRANLRQLTTVLRLARSQAATTRKRVRVFLDKESGHYWLEGTNRRGALSGMRLGDVRLVWPDADRRQGYIAFYGDGSSSGGKLILEDSVGRLITLEVEVITGKVFLTTERERT